MNTALPRYADISEAVGHEDGLAVVGILFQLSGEDNPSLGPLLDTVTSAGWRLWCGGNIY